MEKRNKELESRVGELERECEALRRENGWLKGLVVGVATGGAATANISAATKNLDGKSPETSKRKRDDTQ